MSFYHLSLMRDHYMLVGTPSIPACLTISPPDNYGWGQIGLRSQTSIQMTGSFSKHFTEITF